MIKTSPNESHNENPVPRDTQLLIPILIGRRDDDDKQPRFQQAWLLCVVGGGGEVTAMHPKGTQCHQGAWRESRLSDPEANNGELQLGLAQMRAVDRQNAWVQDARTNSITKAGIPPSAEQESCLKRLLTRCGQRRPRRYLWIQGPTMCVLNWHRITMRSDSDVSMKNQCNKSRHPVLD